RAETALVPDYDGLYARAMNDPERFWTEIAQEIEWDTNPTSARAAEGDATRWFVGGRGNLVSNCLDRHLHESRRDKLALIWLGEGGAERRFTYSELHRLVCKFASGLKELGIGMGDRLCLLMPATPEGLAALLAAARLGAIATIGTASAGAAGLRGQIEATGAKLIITADNAAEDGEGPSRKALAEEAIAGMATPPRLIVHRRAGATGGGKGAGEIDLADLLKGASPRCEPTSVDSEHPLFVLPAATADQGGGLAFVHGGYAVGVAYITRIAYDLKDEDIYWPLAEGAWLASHPAALLGPLLNGATIVLSARADLGGVRETIDRLGVTTLLTTSPILRQLLIQGAEQPVVGDATTLRLLICDGPPLAPEEWWRAYRQLLREAGQLCANWWEPAMGAPVIGTLPSMIAKPGWLGKPLPGIQTSVSEQDRQEQGAPGAGQLRFVGTWPQMARNGGTGVGAGVTAKQDADGYITLLGDTA
ncbi:MAG TPA: AMP-binding protein, partial [Thermomicrobiales bacterium]